MSQRPKSGVSHEGTSACCTQRATRRNLANCGPASHCLKGKVLRHSRLGEGRQGATGVCNINSLSLQDSEADCSAGAGKRSATQKPDRCGAPPRCIFSFVLLERGGRNEGCGLPSFVKRERQKQRSV